MRKLLFLLTIGGISISCAPAAGPAAAPRPSPSPAAGAAGPGDAAVLAVADEMMQRMIEWNPELATFLGLPFPVHHLITDHSLDALAARRVEEDRWRARLASIDPAAIGERQNRVLLGTLRHHVDSEVGTRVCRQELWSVSQLFGWQVQYPQLAQVQPVDGPEQRAAALTRFGALTGYIDSEIANLREGLRVGFVAPRVNAERVLEQVDNLLVLPAAESPFGELARRAGDPEFEREVHALIDQAINPALRRYRDFLAGEYLPRARAEVGVSVLPDGEACYAALVASFTTLPLSPREVHEIGLREMEGIHGEMQEVGRRLWGMADVPAILERFRTDPELLFDSREEILAAAQAAYERARAEMPRWFGILPRAEVVIEPYPAFQEASAPLGQYWSPAEDGSRPGRYMINLYRPERQPRGLIEGIAFHETVPGHHLQITIAQELEGVHPLQRYLMAGAFTEGWGLYSERLADEMGLYSTELDRLGMLSLQAFRAARLVVDAGIHALGWDRQRAIDYMAATTAESLETIEVEVDRYIITPGQATSYKVGMLEIVRLRALAERRLGDGFDIRVFHDRVLEDGGVTLPMLREKIETWVATEAGLAP
jgi:uncharacterized protein (DUF885 family)